MLSQKCQVNRATPARQISVKFYVYETDGPAILKLMDSKTLNLISVNPLVKHVTVSVLKQAAIKSYKNIDDLCKEFPDRLEGQGKFVCKGKPILKDNARPVISAPRKYPVHMKTPIQNAIKQMEKNEIMEKIPSIQSCICQEAKREIKHLSRSTKHKRQPQAHSLHITHCRGNRIQDV